MEEGDSGGRSHIEGFHFFSGCNIETVGRQVAQLIGKASALISEGQNRARGSSDNRGKRDFLLSI